MMAFTMTANRQLQLLLWILYEVVLIRISEGTCMADIEGPYQNASEMSPPTKTIIRASESEPVVLYCHYTCYEFRDNEPSYNFRLYVDILDECSDETLPRISMGMSENFAECNFTVATTIINECTNQTNNRTTFEAQVFVGLYAPTILAVCGVYSFSNNTHCYSTSTFAIINNDTACIQQPTSTEPPTVIFSTPPPSPTPTTTEQVTSTNSIQPPSPQQPTSTEPPTVTVSTPSPNSAQPPTRTSEIGKITLSAPAFGLMVGILCAIVAIETLLLIIFVFFFLKYKKFRGNLNKVTTIQVRENIAAQK